ncbi:hypothetical protein OJAV_G00213480 [Oryzias javanicus]|uniref:C-type lectin domain-containing protein n=1 Tax=Oryzias javanicus TaxID=123683 RepID=A0A437C3B8_ORYJA|nr:hypothetical protein OJAV_G00213480 [Oryzias javanicus]
MKSQPPQTNRRPLKAELACEGSLDKHSLTQNYLANMGGKQLRKTGFEDGSEILVCQEDLEDEEHQHDNNRIQLKVLNFSMSQGRCRTLAAVSLMILAAVLLIADIALAHRYNKLADPHLITTDVDQIGEELDKLQEAYKTSVESIKGAQKQFIIEENSQTETNWEFEHQTRRSKDYQDQIGQFQGEISKLRSHLPIISDGCKYCPEGWLFLNSNCYFYDFSDRFGVKTWQKAREFCQMYGGDLLVLNSKDKENSTVKYLMDHQNPSRPEEAFWFGLSDSQAEKTWKWVDGTILVEGYWMQGEPNDFNNNEDCATVTAKKNIFQAWNDSVCNSQHKWICEKVPSTQTDPL